MKVEEMEEIEKIREVGMETVETVETVVKEKEMADVYKEHHPWNQ